MEIHADQLLLQTQEPLQLKPLWNGELTEENYHVVRQTPRTVKTSVAMWPPSLKYVQPELRTYELCKLAIISDFDVLQYMPREAFTKEEYYDLCFRVVTSNGFHLRDVPTDVLTQELVDRAHRYTCCAIMYTPREFLTEDLCWKAIARNGEMLKYIPEDMITEDMRNTAGLCILKREIANKEQASAMTEQLMRDGEIRCPVQ